MTRYITKWQYIDTGSAKSAKTWHRADIPTWISSGLMQNLKSVSKSFGIAGVFAKICHCYWHQFLWPWFKGKIPILNYRRFLHKIWKLFFYFFYPRWNYENYWKFDMFYAGPALHKSGSILPVDGLVVIVWLSEVVGGFWNSGKIG